VAAGIASLVVADQTYDLSGTCEYTITLPNSAIASTSGPQSDISITYVDSGYNIYFLTGVAEGIDFNYGGRSCDTTAEIVTAYGLAIAEQTMNSGNCTSSQYDDLYGYALAANSNLQWGPYAWEEAFHHQYQSYEAGTIFFGQFMECMEYPIGQPSSYVCSYDNYGPIF